jgi:ubiquinone/menaquinone biosynthesis C-methylase UbiE
VADVYATITGADPVLVSRIADVLELRAADPQQRVMREMYLRDIEFPAEARVLDLGCGTGAVTRVLARWPGVGEVVGVDPSPMFLARARRLDPPGNVTFVEGDCRALAFDDQSFDAAVFHTTLCHVPAPEVSLREAARVLRPHGRLAVFDGDYATTTVAVTPADPLQACADAWVKSSVHDPWLVRRLPELFDGAGFRLLRMRSYGYVETAPASYIPTIIDRGADALVAAGHVNADTATALKAEARNRVAANRFFGHIAYASLVATQRAAEPAGSP